MNGRKELHEASTGRFSPSRDRQSIRIRTKRAFQPDLDNTPQHLNKTVLFVHTSQPCDHPEGRMRNRATAHWTL
jgi:hypothetical protein